MDMPNERTGNELPKRLVSGVRPGMDCETRKMHNVHRWFILGGLGGFTSRLIARVARATTWVIGVIHLLTKCP